MKISKPNLLNLNEQTYLILHELIITNKLKPGTRINYDQLSKELGVSKTPLRDAINRLSQEGLIEIKPRSGTYVAVPNINDAIEVYDVRKALERQAVHLAMKHIPTETIEELLKLNDEVREEFLKSNNFQIFLKSDRKIHSTILQYSNNSRLITIMKSLNAQINWFGYLIVDRLKERAFAGIEHHEMILKAMLNKDVESAMEHMENHIEEVKKAAVDDFSEN